MESLTMQAPESPRDPPWPSGYDACRFESLLDPQAGWPGHHFINVQHCGGLSMGPLQLEDPSELFVKSREFLPGSRFLSRRNMT